MLEKQLKQLGFGKNEIKIYLALFDLGKTKAGEIIKYTGLHRNIVYQDLEDLLERGLVSKTIKNGVANFMANSPQSLIDLIDGQKLVAKSVVEQLNKKQKESGQEIVVYEGEEGLKRSRQKMLSYNKGDVLHVFAPQNSAPMEKFFRQFHAKRDQKGIDLKIMYERGVDPRNLDWRNSLEHSEARYLPLDIGLPVWFAFIEDFLEIGVPGDPMLVFNIKSEEAVTGFKAFFDYFWEQNVSVTTGIEAIQKTMYKMLGELNSGEEYLVLGASAGDSKNNIQKVYDEFHYQRIQKGVVTKMLVYQESFQKIKDRFVYCGDKEGEFSQLRSFVSAPPIPMQINLYNNKVFFIFYGDEPTVISFDKPEVFDGLKIYFDEMWNQENQVLRGPKALQNIWLEAVATGELKFIGARGYFIDQYPELFAEVKVKSDEAFEKGEIKWKNIVDSGVRGHVITEFPWVETRYSLSDVKNPNVVWLYNGKVAIANWAGNEPVIFVSQNKQLVQSYNDHFEELWLKR